MTLFSEIDHKANAKEADMELGASKLIIFGNAKVGTVLMQQDPSAGLDLPLKIFVYEEKSNAVKIAYRDATSLQDSYNIEASKTTAKINAIMNKITTKASQCSKD